MKATFEEFRAATPFAFAANTIGEYRLTSTGDVLAAGVRGIVGIERLAYRIDMSGGWVEALSAAVKKLKKDGWPLRKN